MSQWLKVVAVSFSAAVAGVLAAALLLDLAALCYDVVKAWHGSGFTSAVDVFKSGAAIDAAQSPVTIAAIVIGNGSVRPYVHL